MEDRTAKQNYLRSEIIDKGYNPDDFIAFLDKKTLGAEFEIDNFTLEDLEKNVKEFISTQPQVEIHMRNSVTSDSLTMTDPNNLARESSSEPREIEYSANLKCQIHSQSPFSLLDRILINVSKPEKHKGGFFSSDYITYLISVNTFSMKVRRRYSDFEWLRQKLMILFPYLMIPPIPKKTATDRFNDKVLNKRMRGFEQFLDSLSRNIDIKNSQIFYDFVQAEDSVYPVRKKVSQYDRRNMIRQSKTSQTCLI